jgi:peptidoglycan/xylan/chitin deacetylase (PgdA/CDA1 family)
MKATVKFKYKIARILYKTRIIEKKIENLSKFGSLILTYHRVVPSKDSYPGLQAGMYVEPESFQMHVRYLKQYFDVVSLSGIFSSFQDMERSGSRRPVCALTFDDGWEDFFEYAYPVLKRNRVPATVFLPTRYIGTTDWFWTDRLGRIMAAATPRTKPEEHGTGSNNPLLERIEKLHGSSDQRLEKAIGLLKDREETEIEEIVAALKGRMDIDTDPVKRVFLNWEEVREMRSSGFVSFGSHTHTHRILVHLKEEVVREELALSKKILLREGVVDSSFIPFCYPNGSSNGRIARMVREAGYHLAVSTGAGWNGRDASPYALKRIPIHQDMTASMEMFGCRIAEIL